jgi:hypothetical protein
VYHVLICQCYYYSNTKALTVPGIATNLKGGTLELTVNDGVNAGECHDTCVGALALIEHYQLKVVRLHQTHRENPLHQRG